MPPSPLSPSWHKESHIPQPLWSLAGPVAGGTQHLQARPTHAEQLSSSSPDRWIQSTQWRTLRKP